MHNISVLSRSCYGTDSLPSVLINGPDGRQDRCRLHRDLAIENTLMSGDCGHGDEMIDVVGTYLHLSHQAPNWPDSLCVIQ